MPTLPPGTEAAAKWAWDKLSGPIASAAGSAAKAKWQAFIQQREWDKAEAEYRQRMRAEYATTKLIGHPNPVPIFDTFVLNLLDTPSAMRLYGYEDLSADPDRLRRDEKRENAMAYLRNSERSHRLVILGKPGAGKSTFLKYLTLRDCHDDSPVTPILIILREWARKSQLKDTDTPLNLPGLMTFISQQYDLCGFPDAQAFIVQLLTHGGAQVMFDGLDEVNLEDRQRETVIATVGDFARKYANAKVLMTSRTAAVDSLQLEKFHFVELADLDSDQQKQFASRWFAGDVETLSSFLTEFGKKGNEAVRAMASTPLLLSMVCLSFAKSRRFSQRKHEVFRTAMEQLLVDWDGGRGILRDPLHPLVQDFDRKAQLFSHVAWSMFNDGKILLPGSEMRELLTRYVRRLKPDNAEQPVDGAGLLAEIEAQTGIITERASQIHGFTHLALQEYFASRYVKENPTAKNIAMLVEMKHLTDDRWRDVLAMTSSMLADAEELSLVWLNYASESIEREPKVVDFLRWAGKKVGVSQPVANDSYPLILATYVRMVLAFEFSRTRSLAFDTGFDVLLARARSLNLELARTRALALDFELAHGLNLHEDYDQELAFEHFLGIILGHVHDQSRDHANALDYARLSASASSLIRALIRDFTFNHVFERFTVRDLASATAKALDPSGTQELVIARGRAYAADRVLDQALRRFFSHKLEGLASWQSLLLRDSLALNIHALCAVWCEHLNVPKLTQIVHELDGQNDTLADTTSKIVKQLNERIAFLRKLCTLTNIATVADKIALLGEPEITWTTQRIGSFSNAFLNLMCDELDVAHQWGFSSQHYHALSVYLEATHQLVRNLPHMNLPPTVREHVQTRLLQPWLPAWPRE